MKILNLSERHKIYKNVFSSYFSFIPTKQFPQFCFIFYVLAKILKNIPRLNFEIDSFHLGIWKNG
jgi:hypothetical protein